MNAYQEIQNTIYRIELAIAEPLDVPELAAQAHHVVHPSFGRPCGIVAQRDEAGFIYLAGCRVTQADPAFWVSRDWPGYPSLPDYLSPGAVSLPPGNYITCTFTAESFSQLVEEALSRAGGVLWRHIEKCGLQVEGAWIEIYDNRANCWHPKYRMDDDVPHFEQHEPKLSQNEGPEMEIQMKMKD